MSTPHLYYFAPKEFRGWWEFMSGRLLVLLDALRNACGSRILISPHKHALGRRSGAYDESTHNIDFWGEVLAADVFVEHVHYRAQVIQIVELAKTIGFTGIGIYPHWKNSNGERQCGFHLDCRTNRTPSRPATWGRIQRKYVVLDAALAQIPIK